MTADEFINISHKLKTNLNVTQRTLENLLNWSLSQMDGIKTEKKKFDVRMVIDEVCHLMREIAERKHLTFETVEPAPALVIADLNQIQLILRNLIHNAIKFSKQNSVIRVHTTTDATHCCIRVEDHGIGMTAEETGMIQGHPHYFTKVGTHEEKGTGLGLLLCKEFVKRNGGELSIRSMPGQGTTVSFTIPLAEEEPSLVVFGK
jgi:signal transduction histidine kinase